MNNGNGGDDCSYACTAIQSCLAGKYKNCDLPMFSAAMCEGCGFCMQNAKPFEMYL